MVIYVLTYSMCDGTEMVSCYDSFKGAINRLKMAEINGSFDPYESFKIEVQELITEGESKLRYNRVKEHYSK